MGRGRWSGQCCSFPLSPPPLFDLGGRQCTRRHKQIKLGITRPRMHFRVDLATNTKRVAKWKVEWGKRASSVIQPSTPTPLHTSSAPAWVVMDATHWCDENGSPSRCCTLEVAEEGVSRMKDGYLVFASLIFWMDACFSTSASAFTSSSFPPHTCELSRGQREQRKKAENTQGGAAQSVMCMFTQVPPFAYLPLARTRMHEEIQNETGKREIGRREEREGKTAKERNTLQHWHHC
mmetsp:Transcript_37961/g.97981  ORF Transcript_37961/g.97981 Transcript_37961/m.97981 type:complete len:235 (+) Transcript_37961:1325-2029(+)